MIESAGLSCAFVSLVLLSRWCICKNPLQAENNRATYETVYYGAFYVFNSSDTGEEV